MKRPALLTAVEGRLRLPAEPKPAQAGPRMGGEES